MEGSRRDSLGEQIKFNTPQEEIAYLRNKLVECRAEFQEFLESSRELEAEYDTQIKQLETKDNESQSLIGRLEGELDLLRTKYNAYSNDTQHKLNEYQQQIGDLTAMNDRLTTYIRELEQSNDDLERARRALGASLEDFEAQLNQQIERNVLLENEVSEKEELECLVQRMKEEARDLRHELIVNKNSSDPSRRKQILMKSCMTTSQNDTSLQSFGTKSDPVQSDDTLDRSISHTILTDSSSPNAGSPSQNGAIPTRVPLVDSTTSPKTPTSLSRFSFSSPFSYARSSTSKSTDSKSQQTSNPPSPTLPAMVMSPSSRISALNIVSDLLKKVGVLESKLASAKKVTG